MSAKIPVLEIFGPTIQGEGAVIGKKTVFVRTAGCDYSCAWCDSKFTWDGSAKHQIRMLSPEEVCQEIFSLAGDSFNHVTISGGNPALIGPQMRELLIRLHNRGVKVGLETQGSRWQDWFLLVDDLTISPKPPSSGMRTDWGILRYIVEKLAGYCDMAEEAYNFNLKVVVFDRDDYEFAKQVHREFPEVPMFLSAGNSDVTPNASKAELRDSILTKLDWLASKVMNDPAMNEVRVLPQLHVLLWGNQRGV